MNPDSLSVTLLTRIIQETLEQGFPFVRVTGEISNYKQHSSGHRYFTLKDEGAQIRALMWKTRNLECKPFDGMKVVVTGRVTLYPSQGNYQIDCFSIAPAGVGDLYLAFEKLKSELLALGYFDESKKKRLPRMPMRVGVATSPTGAAVRDILSTLEQRMPAATVVFRPTLVQGEGSSADIVKAIRQLDEARCDVIIVGRGGGSIEDLWSFNTRAVADAIFQARTPIISAVGHETDVCIADFVADVRAATPTAAAVLCSPIRADELLFELDQREDRMSDSIQRLINDKQEMVSQWFDGMMQRIIVRAIDEKVRKAQDYAEKYSRLMLHRLQLHNAQLDGAERTMRSLQPLAPLKRGFALLRKDGKLLSAEQELVKGDTLSIQRLTQSVDVEVL